MAGFREVLGALCGLLWRVSDNTVAVPSNVIDKGSDKGISGTSASTPAFAGVVALLNAARKQAKLQMRDTIATIAGMLLPLLTQFGHHH